jgi:hypothetical protein
MVRFTNAALVTVTIPVFATTAFLDGDRVGLFASGAGGVTLSVAGLTLAGSAPPLTVAQNELLVVECLDASADLWAVVGGTAA